ncbi:hypothetical protein K474DRAFT_1571619, partial [Panus rudis PR-1116 ss-1]
MPSILNLKFKGNKSFVPFSNLSDADSLTKTWKVCTKVASFLEQGQRLENLSWRLWHLQNLMVDSDNARSKREFRKLSKCMSDKLDKEKGRSIEELEAPGFRRNHSTDMIQQRAVEKEREREASHNGRTIHRMQFTFSVDQPSAPPTGSAAAKKPDMKPSAEFKDSRRGRPATRASIANSSNNDVGATEGNDKDPPSLTARGRKFENDSTTLSLSSHHHSSTNTSSSNGAPDYSTLSLRFPSLFSNDFGPAALLYPTPTLTNGMTYGEGVNSTGGGGNATNGGTDGFSIVRPTIELGLDELLNADSPDGWSSSGFGDNASNTNANGNTDAHENAKNDMKKGDGDPNEEDVDMKDSTAFGASASSGMGMGVVEDVVPRTITPSRLGPDPSPPPANSSSSSNNNNNNHSINSNSNNTNATATATTTTTTTSGGGSGSAPGGVKAECSNCGATHTPLWRRGLNDELNCNACGLYCKLHKRPRPKSMRNNHGEGRSQAAPRQESQEVVAQCYNCHTTATPLWRKDDEGKTVCNAYKLHGSARPISMKSDVIRKRARHDARRGSSGGSGGGAVSETPSASPGASRRASPSADSGTPVLAPDSNTQSLYDSRGEYPGAQGNGSELMGALGDSSFHHSGGNVDGSGGYGHTSFLFSSAQFPGPYHPDYLSQMYSLPGDAFGNNRSSSNGNGGDSDYDYDVTDGRSAKRRRMSDSTSASASASEPPSSAVSFSSFDGFSASSRSSLDFSPYSSSSASGNNANNNALWHPPMLPPSSCGQDSLMGSPHLSIHPPMLPPPTHSPSNAFSTNSPTDDGDNLFAKYFHPPMLPPDCDSPKIGFGSLSGGGLGLHPPMLPSEW